jgi:hypothetical protein
MGDQGASTSTLRTLVGKYPSSPAADQARQRLAKSSPPAAAVKKQ